MSRPSEERIPRAAFIALAVALPIALACVHAHWGHAGDIEFFHRWYLATREGNSFYVDGPGINYPIVGVALVALPARLVDLFAGQALALEDYWLVLKATLVLGEIALILSSEWVARSLHHPQPRTLALVLYALPSSWVGGAFFGQIDVWGSVMLLGAAGCAVRYWQRGETTWLLGALVSLVLAILTKQLTWFAVPALAALIALGLRLHATKTQWLFVACAPLLLVLADPFLALPEGTPSHLLFVVLHGSSHGDLAVASGASLWSLIASGGTPASSLHWLGLDSRSWGWLVFLLATSWILSGAWRSQKDCGWVLAAGLCQLAMALLLTGVHERYLAHAIPLIFVARGLRAGLPLWLGIAIGVVSGFFVLSTISPSLEAVPLLSRPEPTALLSLAWGLALMRESLARTTTPNE